jgi:putative membrane protein
LVGVLDFFRRWFTSAGISAVGTTPDYRFSLANERTFLAWIRTALALVGGGVAVDQFLPELDPPYLRTAIAVALIALGGFAAGRAVVRWIQSERAIRLGEDLPPSRFPGVLAALLAIGALFLATAILAG